MFSLQPPQPSLFFAANRPRFTTSHSPNTPSPLRTSRNANLMSNSRHRDETPRQGLLNSSPLASKFGGVETKENQYEPESGNQFNLFHTPVDKTREATRGDSQLITPPYSASNAYAEHQHSSLTSATTPSFNFSHPPQTLSSSNKSASQWESRARSASPAVSIARHAADGREKKKSQFLDRIRRRRDDNRADNTGDQVLRMDFVAERRVWEDEMRRRAGQEQNANPEIDIDIDIDLELDAEMMEEPCDLAYLSPTDEHNMDEAELASYFEEIQAKNHSQEFLIDEDFDGEEYDALFVQALSQDPNRLASVQASDQMQPIQASQFAQHQQHQHQQHQHQQHQHQQHHHHHQQQQEKNVAPDQQPFDTSMDMS